MKKLLTVLLTVMMAFTVCTVNVLADGEELVEDEVETYLPEKPTVKPEKPPVEEPTTTDFAINMAEPKFGETIPSTATVVVTGKGETATPDKVMSWKKGDVVNTDTKFGEGKYTVTITLTLSGADKFAAQKDCSATINGDTINVVISEGDHKATITKSYTIDAAPTSIAVPTAKVGLQYTGKEQTGVEEGEGYTLQNNKATAVGTYYAVAVLEPGYEWDDATKTGTKTIEWEIKPAEIDIADVEISNTADLVYSGFAKQVIFSGLETAEENAWMRTIKHYTVTYQQHKKGPAGDKVAAPKDEWVDVTPINANGEGKEDKYRAVIKLDAGYKFVEEGPLKETLPEAKPEPELKKTLQADGTLTIEFKIAKRDVMVSLQKESVEARFVNGELVKQAPVVKTNLPRYIAQPEFVIEPNGAEEYKEPKTYNVKVKLSEEDKANYRLVEVDDKGNTVEVKAGGKDLKYVITKIYAGASLKNNFVRWNDEVQNPEVLINGKALDPKYFEVKVDNKKDYECEEVGTYKVTVSLKGEGKKFYTFDRTEKTPATEKVDLTYIIVKANQAQINLYNGDAFGGYKANLDSDCEMQLTNIRDFDDTSDHIKLERRVQNETMPWVITWEEVENFELAANNGEFNVEPGNYRLTVVGDENHNDAVTYFNVSYADAEHEYTIDSERILVHTNEVTMVCDYDYVEFDGWFNWDNLKDVTVYNEETETFEDVIWTVEAGSTEVTINTETLAVGDYTVSFHYENGMHVEGNLRVYPPIYFPPVTGIE